MLLPADYDTSTRRYPTLYLLHGLGDDHTAWSSMTNVSEYSAAYPIIIVMPDAGRSFYVNSGGGPQSPVRRFHCEGSHRLGGHPLSEHSAAAFPSRGWTFMGGYGAALIGLKHYQKFAVLGSFSGTVGVARPESAPEEGYREWQNHPLGPLNSPERADHDPFAWLEKVPPVEMPDIYLACGGQDRLIEQNRDSSGSSRTKK
jgi:putative tributyrin esterase